MLQMADSYDKKWCTWCLNSDVWASLLCNVYVLGQNKKQHSHSEKSREHKPCI